MKILVKYVKKDINLKIMNVQSLMSTTVKISSPNPPGRPDSTSQTPYKISFSKIILNSDNMDVKSAPISTIN